MDVDHQGKPVPGLALSWKPVNDLNWQFALRRGVTFHDGEHFKADTELFNLDYTFDITVWAVGLVAGATLVGVSGTLATRSVVNHPPVATLRGG